VREKLLPRRVLWDSHKEKAKCFVRWKLRWVTPAESIRVHTPWLSVFITWWQSFGIAVKSNKCYPPLSTWCKVIMLVESNSTHRQLPHQKRPCLFTCPEIFFCGTTKEDASPSPPVKTASHLSHPSKTSDQQYPESQLKHSSLASSINQTAGCVWKV